MKRQDPRNRLVHVLLVEVLGGEEPPDLSADILARAFPPPEGQPAQAGGPAAAEPGAAAGKESGPGSAGPPALSLKARGLRPHWRLALLLPAGLAAAAAAVWLFTLGPLGRPPDGPGAGGEGAGRTVETLFGSVRAKGDGWLEVQAYGAARAERYEAPRKGGAPDGAALEGIAAVAAGDDVKLLWVFDGARRIVQVERLAPGDRQGRPAAGRAP